MRKKLLSLTKPLAVTGTYFDNEVHTEELRAAMKNITTVKDAWQAIGIYSHTNSVANE